MATKTINLSLDDELLKLLDQAAANAFASRSDYMRQLIVQRVRPEPKDEWDELLEMADDMEARARARGYTTDEDSVRAVKEMRAERAAEDGKVYAYSNRHQSAGNTTR